LPLSHELAFGGGLKWWGPSWKELGFLVLNYANTEVYNVDTFVDQLLIKYSFIVLLVSWKYMITIHGCVCMFINAL
jgi:hypothetical protein